MSERARAGEPPVPGRRRVRILVSGRVQGVFFRATTVERARELGLAGHARNLPDGRVEVEAEGTPSAVEALVAFCHEGPPAARVTGVELVELEPAASGRGFVGR
jgi:acylphosphatase